MSKMSEEREREDYSPKALLPGQVRLRKPSFFHLHVLQSREFHVQKSSLDVHLTCHPVQCCQHHESYRSHCSLLQNLFCSTHCRCYYCDIIAHLLWLQIASSLGYYISHQITLIKSLHIGLKLF